MSILGKINPDLLELYAPQPTRYPLLPELSDTALVALMCRMLVREGWNEHLAGHISCRLPNGNLLVNPWELTWTELTASDIVTLDSNGKNLSGNWNVSPAIGLHLQIHDRRPDVGVVVHNHADWSGIWANLHRVPAIFEQAAGYVNGELPLYNEYEGTFEDAEKTQAAVDALGEAKWALLANHGSLVVGSDLRQAHLRVVTLERRARRAWEVEVAGGGIPLADDELNNIALPDKNGFPFLWEAMARRELREDPAIIE